MAISTSGSLLGIVLLYIIQLNCCICVRIVSENSHVVHMQKLHNVEERIETANSHQIVKRAAPADIGSCRQKNDTFEGSLNDLRSQGRALANEFKFENETRFTLALAWAKANSGNILVVTSSLYSVHDSMIYRSTDYGKSFSRIQDKIGGTDTVIRKENGLQKDPLDANQIYIVAYSKEALLSKSELYITQDGGQSFSKSDVPFVLDGSIVFHPNKAYRNYMMTFSTAQNALYYTKDRGVNWVRIKSFVKNFKWSTIEKEQPDVIYITQDKQRDLFEMLTNRDIHYTLMKTDLSAKKGGEDFQWTTLHENVYSFGMEGDFLFVSVPDPKEKTFPKKIMRISKSGGTVWNDVQVPSITPDRFYSILDMTEGMVFLHVDEPGDTGKGTLYTSDGTGVIFAESLRNHLYPNFLDLTDFYKVQSMRGVYLASQLNDDRSIHTMISYDRGGEWTPIKNVVGATCKDPSKGCFLQIHNAYSMSRKVQAQPPLSVESAPGLIMVHGHVAESLQTTQPDVFISSDGGYSWYKALDGPHIYEIVDQGGLLVALPSDTPTPSTIKFSTDEGRCWHSYKFTNMSITFTKLLTEPGNKAMSVSVWGYTNDDHIWRVHVIDFSLVVNKLCGDNDYQEFLPHVLNGQDGCLLGVKEKIQRLKPNSWCRNGNSRPIKDTSKQSKCLCTYEDFECDFGFYRKAQSLTCERDPRAKVDRFSICLHGDRSEIITKGYRKIPGDLCEGGKQPTGEKILNTKEKCDDPDLFVKREFQISGYSGPSNRTTVILLGLAVTILLLMVIMMAFFIRKCYQLRVGRERYRYSMLQQSDNVDVDMDQEVENTIRSNTSLYDDRDQDSQRNEERQGLLMGGVGFPNTNGSIPNGVANSAAVISPTRQTDTTSTQNQPPKVKSYHDESDDDLLE